MKKIVNITLIIILIFHTACSGTSDVIQEGSIVSMKNDRISLEFDLSSGTYGILDLIKNEYVIEDASLRMNEFSSTGGEYSRSFNQRRISGVFGKGETLELLFESSGNPEYIFSFTIYDDHKFISISSSFINNTRDTIFLKDIYPMEGADLYEGCDISENFALVDGFSGGEPLEYGKRIYSPLTKEYALKSRNNIALTFGRGDARSTIVMGGLTYHDFEKFAYIEQPRKVELLKGADGAESLLAYLNLPDDIKDGLADNPGLELISRVSKRTWDNNEFRCSETAVLAMNEGSLEIRAVNLDNGNPYFLGFSWWRGMRHGDRKDHRQSVFIVYEDDNGTHMIPLVQDELLPRFDGRMKEDVRQVEIPVPPEAVAAGEFKILVEKTPDNYENSANDPNAYLSEIWLRDGVHEPLLPQKLTDINDCIRVREEYHGNLFARDPVGKRIDPGSRYDCPDKFYIDICEKDPFVALEEYGRNVKKAQDIELSMYDFPTVCLWYAEVDFYGGGIAENSTAGAVKEMRIIRESGFLDYSRAAVRLVPDSYLPDNQQGWWDDEHWQMEETDLNASHNGRYVEPYETSEKWGKAVTELGGIPLTYFQAGFRSEDYAHEFPGHMLFNKTYAWRGEPKDTAGELFTTWNQTWTRNRQVWGYDYTDPDFLDHLKEVYENLAMGGIKGLMFDYPGYAWSYAGGFEDKYATAASAYRNIFRMPYEGLGPGSYVHERNMERGTDVSIGYVASMRTENDTDRMDPTTVTRCGLRWYKNRVIYNQDTDSKNIARLQDNRDDVRAVLTMAYVTTGRFLLANSFDQLTGETLWDMTRTFPYHRENKSARPVDAFVSEVPMVYDYEVDDSWHQVTFYNPDFEVAKTIGIDISGAPVDGALAMDPNGSYHVYDFWNDRYIGMIAGTDRLEQELRPGEARMMSVREVLGHPQVISTNRHIMQGYLDTENVEWDSRRKVLSGLSKVVGGDPYIISVAGNGFEVDRVECKDADIELAGNQLAVIKVTIKTEDNKEVEWSIGFSN